MDNSQQGLYDATSERIGSIYALAIALRQPQLEANRNLALGAYVATIDGKAGFSFGASHTLQGLLSLPGSVSLSFGVAGSEFAFKVGLGYRF